MRFTTHHFPSFRILILCMLLFTATTAWTQNCSSFISVPDTVNGIAISAQFSGSVSTFPTANTSCNQISTPENATWLGPFGAFSYVLSFSSPVSAVTIALTGTGAMENEHFVFNTNSGVPQLIMLAGCYSNVTNNELVSGMDPDTTVEGSSGGGWFMVSLPSGFTELTISGEGGSGGTLLALCAEGLFSFTQMSPCNEIDALDLPNVLTPNNDGVNDFWALPADYADCAWFKCRFFNRWGEQVYYMSEHTTPFCGKDQSDKQLSDGVYWYLFESHGNTRHGLVTITR